MSVVGQGLNADLDGQRGKKNARESYLEMELKEERKKQLDTRKREAVIEEKERLW